MTPTRVAIIGCGRIARSTHLPAWVSAREAGLCSIVGLCDLDRTLADELGAAHDVPVFSSAQQMLDIAKPDVVDISTAVASHRQLCLMAIEAGCHILCEKPIAMNAAEAREILAAARRNDRLFSICLQYRTWDEARYIRQRVMDGDLGHVHFVRTWGGEVHGFALHRRTAPGNGVLSHWTIHNLDLALWMLGGPEPLTASALCHQRIADYPQALGPERDRHDDCQVLPSIEDFACGLVRLEGGTAISFEANWLQQPLSRPEGFELLGSKGSAAVCPLSVQLDRDYQWVDQTPPQESMQPSEYRMDRLMSEFLEAVRTGGDAPVSSEEVMRIQILVDALYESARTGREVLIAKESVDTDGVDTAR